MFNLIKLLFKEYFRLIIISALLAIPIAHYWTGQWLGGFTFRIHQSWWVYVLPTIIVVLIAALTVGWLSYKTATTNPADSLRDD